MWEARDLRGDGVGLVGLEMRGAGHVQTGRKIVCPGLLGVAMRGLIVRSAIW